MREKSFSSIDFVANFNKLSEFLSHRCRPIGIRYDFGVTDGERKKVVVSDPLKFQHRSSNELAALHFLTTVKSVLA